MCDGDDDASVSATGHWGGDPREFCAALEIQVPRAEARDLARLYRHVGDAAARARLYQVLAALDATAPAPSGSTA
jgi:hypothetical protein